MQQPRVSVQYATDCVISIAFGEGEDPDEVFVCAHVKYGGQAAAGRRARDLAAAIVQGKPPPSQSAPDMDDLRASFAQRFAGNDILRMAQSFLRGTGGRPSSRSSAAGRGRGQGRPRGQSSQIRRPGPGPRPPRGSRGGRGAASSKSG